MTMKKIDDMKSEIETLYKERTDLLKESSCVYGDKVCDIDADIFALQLKIYEISGEQYKIRRF